MNEKLWKQFLRESEQYEFPFYKNIQQKQLVRPQVSKQPESEELTPIEIFESCFEYDSGVSAEELLPILDTLKIKHRIPKYILKPLLIIEHNSTTFVADDMSEIQFEEASEWLDHLQMSGDPTDYYEINELKTFWSPGVVVYHATDPENYDSIMRNGLNTDCKTRGLANRHVGCALFTSFEPESLDSYGNLVFEIDIGAMARDGIAYQVEREPGFDELDALKVLYALLGQDSDYLEHEDKSLDPSSVIIYGSVDPKYIKEFSN